MVMAAPPLVTGRLIVSFKAANREQRREERHRQGCRSIDELEMD